MEKISKQKLKELYIEYNRLYFNNQLGKCNFSAVKLKSLGFCSYAKNSKGIYTCRIWITNDVDWTEDTLRQILVHEMVHYYVMSIDRKWSGLFGHGRLFRKRCREIEKAHGIKVPVHPHIYHKNEKTPTTFWGKFKRALNYGYWPRVS